MINISTGVAGFEPTSEGVKVLCLTAWLYPISDLCNYKGLLYRRIYKWNRKRLQGEP